MEQITASLNPSKEGTCKPKFQKKRTILEFISQNYAVFQTLLKIGKIPFSVAFHYKIYLFYKGLNQPKMLAYSLTAEAFNVSENTVQRAVKEMEEIVVVSLKS